MKHSIIISSLFVILISSSFLFSEKKSLGWSKADDYVLQEKFPGYILEAKYRIGRDGNAPSLKHRMVKGDFEMKLRLKSLDDSALSCWDCVSEIQDGTCLAYTMASWFPSFKYRVQDKSLGCRIYTNVEGSSYAIDCPDDPVQELAYSCSTKDGILYKLSGCISNQREENCGEQACTCCLGLPGDIQVKKIF